MLRLIILFLTIIGALAINVNVYSGTLVKSEDNYLILLKIGEGSFDANKVTITSLNSTFYLDYFNNINSSIDNYVYFDCPSGIKHTITFHDVINVGTDRGRIPQPTIILDIPNETGCKLIMKDYNNALERSEFNVSVCKDLTCNKNHVQKVLSVQPTATLSVSPSTINVGESVTITLTANNCYKDPVNLGGSYEITDDKSEISYSGTFNGNLSISKSFTLTQTGTHTITAKLYCYNGIITKTATVRVNKPSPTPSPSPKPSPSVSLSVTPTSINQYESIEITATINNCNGGTFHIWDSQGEYDKTGNVTGNTYTFTDTIQLTIPGTHTISLSATCNSNNYTDSKTVIVNEVPLQINSVTPINFTAIKIVTNKYVNTINATLNEKYLHWTPSQRKIENYNEKVDCSQQGIKYEYICVFNNFIANGSKITIEADSKQFNFAMNNETLPDILYYIEPNKPIFIAFEGYVDISYKPFNDAISNLTGTFMAYVNETPILYSDFSDYLPPYLAYFLNISNAVYLPIKYKNVTNPKKYNLEKGKYSLLALAGNIDGMANKVSIDLSNFEVFDLVWDFREGKQTKVFDLTPYWAKPLTNITWPN
ncbi:NEQ033 [Nanoarchaeum equitans Kin4-M]|uniref:NEQ033 n=1 Tax=Nanoarchaeum equitans (strain Kin4-M) TaxID=228908 RepID=Q74MG2_NANEQ|nr:NEQ033 [Nanoarchaeum equitans Kin4-M]